MIAFHVDDSGVSPCPHFCQATMDLQIWMPRSLTSVVFITFPAAGFQYFCNRKSQEIISDMAQVKRLVWCLVMNIQ